MSSKLELATCLNGEAPEPRSPSELNSVISELALNLEEVISRERALGEVLRIISASQGNLNLVMPSILGDTLELCDAEYGILFEYRQNNRFHARFQQNIPPGFQVWLDDMGSFTVAATNFALDRRIRRGNRCAAPLLLGLALVDTTVRNHASFVAVNETVRRNHTRSVFLAMVRMCIVA